MKKENSIIIYQDKKMGVKLETHLENESVWLTQKQMSRLFNKDLNTISEHISNVFKEKELKETSVTRNFRVTASDGKSYKTQVYNLDVIISIGYRVKSLQGTNFRIWATNVLRKHIVDGYTINESRLLEESKKLKDLQEAVAFIQDASRKELFSDKTKDILNILSDYSKALVLND